MALVPALNLHQPADDEAARRAPSNIEAEQALLGILLYDNGAYERIGDELQADHFFEPFHGRLFGSIEHAIRRGNLAEPILLATTFEDDEAFQELGGIRYLADLFERAPPAANARDYAKGIFDLAVRRELIRIGGEIMYAAAAPDREVTPRDLIEQAEASLFALAEPTNSGGGFSEFGVALDEAMRAAALAYERDGGLSGLATHLIDLDQKLGGLHGSDLLILAGRPSMGKTALATNIAYRVAKAYAYEDQPDGTRKTISGGVVGFYSLEMSRDQLATRIIADASGVSSDRIRKGDVTVFEFGQMRDASDELRRIPLHIDATGGISIAKLAARARRLKRKHGLDLLIVDYLQLVTWDAGRRDSSRVQEVSAITAGLKALAKELNVPVIALSQLSRKVENREGGKPQLSDLRESGSIEQDADAVLFVHREAYYLARNEPRAGSAEHLTWTEEMSKVQGLAEVIIGKQRHGPIGTVRLAFNEDLTRFDNLARESHFDFGNGYRDPTGAS